MQVFEPSAKGSVMVEGDTFLTLHIKPSGTHTFNLGFCPVGTAEAQTYAARVQMFVDDGVCVCVCVCMRVCVFV